MSEDEKYFKIASERVESTKVMGAYLMQTKYQSLIESLTNILIGYLTALFFIFIFIYGIYQYKV